MKTTNVAILSPHWCHWCWYFRRHSVDIDARQHFGSIVRIVDGKLVRVAHVFSHHPPEYLIK